MSWIRSENHIAIQEGSQIAHLEAIDVYDAIQTDDFVFDNIHQGSLRSVFAELDFSPVSYEVRIVLQSANNNIIADFCTGNTSADFVHGELLDQIIDGDSWHYIDNCDEVKNVLKETGITGNGIISVSSYMALIKNSFGTDLVDNQVDSDLLKKTVSYEQPKGLQADLFPYQKTGVAWLDYMLEGCHGCILGDEMGLGKTLQAIALIQVRKDQGKKCLVIAPVSLLDNWKEECKKFAPDLRVLIHHGAQRTGSPAGFNNYDVIVTSYGHAVTDNLLFSLHTWDFIILDEAQNIKNPHSNRAKCVKEIPALDRLAITGTPFENHVTDIWSLTDFILPGYLGSESAFENMISDDISGATALEPFLSSIMIRRLVKDVAQDLPEKVVIPQPLSMSEKESDAYEEVRQELHDKGMTTLPAIQRLRMYCTHLKLYDHSITGDPAKYSLKYERTCEILQEIFDRHEKALIFTSYQKMFDIFMEDIPERFNVPVDYINGTTPVSLRQKKVDLFNQYEGSSLLILNPRAAGTGLNITAANHVIHYNPEWNPAVEDQASARAYRRGQKKTTFIYRLYYLGTVEEIINERIERKREMASTAVIGSDGSKADMQDIIHALELSPKEKIQ